MKFLGMRMIFGRRTWLRAVLVISVGGWLGLGPLLAASDLWRAAPDCCCGSGSVCLLGGCDCGARGVGDGSPCGGMRSSEDFGSTPTLHSFGLHLGLATQDLGVGNVLPVGETRADRGSLPQPLVTSPDPPPPRDASAR